MNIINISSKYTLSNSQIEFTERIIACGKDYYHHENEIYCLSKSIPIYLVEPNEFKNMTKRIDYEFKEYDSQKPSTEMLGLYVSKGRHNIKEIYLCPENILKCTSNNDKLMQIVAKVIVHELAHAYMDQREKYIPIDEFYSWIEESMANNITLQYFESYYDNWHHKRRCNCDNEILSHSSSPKTNYVFEFIMKQPPNYKLGLYLYHARFRHEHFWYNNKKETQKKSKAKAEWLNYVKSIIGYDISKVNLKELFEKTEIVLLEDPYNEINKNNDAVIFL